MAVRDGNLSRMQSRAAAALDSSDAEQEEPCQAAGTPAVESDRTKAEGTADRWLGHFDRSRARPCVAELGVGITLHPQQWRLHLL